jgi:hypothetical protein
MKKFKITLDNPYYQQFYLIEYESLEAIDRILNNIELGLQSSLYLPDAKKIDGQLNVEEEYGLLIITPRHWASIRFLEIK